MGATLIIARHGNTFEPDDIPTRVGARTDLPLVEKGFEQGRAIGRYLKEHDLIPDQVFVSELQRTQQTAAAAIEVCGLERDFQILPMLNEIDYGPDENKPEADVIARIGEEAIRKWDEDATVPDGWNVDPQQIISDWKAFAKTLSENQGGITLVMTSNGVARFAPNILKNPSDFQNRNYIKLKTGAFGIFRCDSQSWACNDWNIRP